MSTRSGLSILAFCIVASGLTPSPAAAATASASFSITATVQASCRTTANAMVFRTYAAAAVNMPSPVSVTCSNSVPYNVSLSAGTGPGDPRVVRELSGSSAALLAYAVGPHRRSAPNDPGKNAGGGILPVTDICFDQAMTGQERISVGQYVAAGAFFDTIVVTVTY
ncbi:MAG: spore coat protein U domain-containing protein [Terracidiphilus sp.]